MQQEKPKVVLVDGSGYIFRAFYALPPMQSPDKIPVNAVYGFFKMLLKLREDYAGHHLRVVFDSGRVTFRNDIYPQYKANRGDPPEELIPQFDLVRKASDALSLPRVELAGYEADDVIATLAKQALAQDHPVVVISSDKDLMQLVRPGLTMYDPMKNRILDEAAVLEKFGVAPHQVIEVQAIAGDSVDNIPGAVGIGIKTAALLINEYGSLENLLANAEQIKQPKRRENLLEFRKVADISLKLVQLCEDVPELDGDFSAMPPFDFPRAQEFVERYGFKSMVRVLADKSVARDATDAKNDTQSGADGAMASSSAPVQKPAKIKADVDIIQGMHQLQQMIDEAKMQGYIALYPEFANDTLVGIGFALHDALSYYLPLNHYNEAENPDNNNAQGDLLAAAFVPKTRRGDIINYESSISLFAHLCMDHAIVKITYDIKKLWRAIYQQGVQLTAYDDVLLLSFVLDAGRQSHQLVKLVAENLGEDEAQIFEDFKQLHGKQDLSLLPLQDIASITAHGAQSVLRLYHILWQRLCSEGMVSLYHRLEKPLIASLTKMEMAGVSLNVQHLQMLSKEFRLELASLEKDIFAIAGEEFNIASPKQMGVILFDNLQLPHGKKTKSGNYSTDNDVLDMLVLDGHVIAKHIQQWRHLSKLLSTYTESLPQMQHKDGRVRTHFSMAGAQTGRLSSIDPNLQNIPIRDAQGKKIREAFTAPTGKLLLSLDYSQIELRLIADIANLDGLIAAFKRGEDVHRFTASEVFGVPLDSVDDAQRRAAKAVNFGIIYGISAFGLARQLMIGRKQAQEYIDNYLLRYQGLKSYMDDTIKLAGQQGYVQTIFGRKIHLPQINDKNPAKRQYAGRQAINAPIQGSAADIIKQAILMVENVIASEKLPVTLLLQVHDELLFEVEESAAIEMGDKLAGVMQQAGERVPVKFLPNGKGLQVPLLVQAGMGKNWADAH